jgi:hypothetical protein
VDDGWPFDVRDTGEEGSEGSWPLAHQTYLGTCEWWCHGIWRIVALLRSGRVHVGRDHE